MAAFIPKHILKRWDELPDQPSSRLLKVALLRNTATALHTVTSKLLSQKGEKIDTRPVVELTRRVNDLVLRDLGSDNLLRTIENAPELSKTQLPETSPAVAAIGAERLNRYDRHWEKRMVVEAEKLGWVFYTLDVYVDVLAAESFDQSLFYSMWPNGVTLFAENANSDASPIKEHEGKSYWHGRWTLSVSPDFDVASIEVDQLSGTQVEIAPIQWRKLDVASH